MQVVFWPDCDNLTRVKVNSVHLGNEDSSHSFIQSSSIHVDGGTDWEHKTSDSFVNTQILLQTTKSDRQCTSTERKCKIRNIVNYTWYNHLQTQETSLYSPIHSLWCWPGGCPQSSDPGLENAQKEGEGVFPCDNKVNAGQEDCSVDDEANNHSHHVHAKLPGYHLQVLDGDDLSTN